jgi:hypothetical protein
MDNIDYPTILTGVLTIAVTLGGLVLAQFRGKVAKLIDEGADILKDISILLVMITAAQTDDKITEAEWKEISGKAVEIKNHILDLRSQLNL